MIPDIVDSPVLYRMGWALLHFLWQGALIALVLKGALMLVEQRFSRLRYSLALACLFLMAALPVSLLCKPQGNNPVISAAYETVPFETASAAGLASASIPIQRRHDFRAAVLHFFTPLVPWIAACWFPGAALLLLKTIGGVIQVRTLKRKAAAHCETYGMKSFHQLAARAGVAGIPVLKSGLVSIPTVAGWFRPVVLLPKGALEKIDRPMLDALVAHEFAHIRRHDSAVNLLQTVIENLLFFHPAMWWMTRNVRAEREACCDDAAVTICGNALVYARALSQAEQFRSSMPVIALSSSPLLQRIRRLTEMRISKMNRVAALCITLFAVFFVTAAAAGSVLLAAIPPQNSQSSISATTGVSQDSDKAMTEAKETHPNKEGQYALVCGIFAGRADGKATGKEVLPMPLPSKDEMDELRRCFLLDVSTPKPSIVSGEVEASNLIHKVDPIYPEQAIKEHIGIGITLSINVNEEGLVTDAEVKRSQTAPPDTDSNGNWVGGAPAGVIRATNSAAINAVKQWKYSPTLLDGKAVPVRATAAITFTFNEDGSPKIISYAP